MKKRTIGIILLVVMVFFAACNGQISNTSDSKEQETVEKTQNLMNETPTAEKSGKRQRGFCRERPPARIGPAATSQGAISPTL